MKVLKYVVIALVLLMIACKPAAKRDTTKEEADALNDQAFKAEELKKDADFIVQIYEVALFQMKGAQLADSVSKSMEVKNLAKKVYDDHVTISGRLTDIASLKKVILPDSLSVAMKTQFNDLLLTKKFDRDYVRSVMNTNEETLSLFNSMKSATSDTTIKNMINEISPNLTEHMKTASTVLQQTAK